MTTLSKFPESIIDRFSSLPDHVAHNVLNFLSMEDISRLCVVSKRFRELCISIPILNFDVLKYKHRTTKRRQLLNYLERFLVLRRGMDTQRCYIRWSSSNKFLDEEYRVYSWLYNALISNVELLEEGEFTLPSSVLFCKSLKILVISNFALSTLHSRYLKFPSSITSVRFSYLQSLSLKYVGISESFGEWVSSYCKFLKNLILVFTSGTKSIIIKSSSLKYLEILHPSGLFHIDVSAAILEDIKLVNCFDSPNNSSLQLSPPSLAKFYWSGSVLNFCYRESFRPMFASLLLNGTPSKASTFTTRCLDSVLCALCNTKVLTMSEASIRVLIEHGCLPTLFINVSSLYLWTGQTSISDELVLALTSLLVGLPNLFYLYIGERNDPDNTKAVVYDEIKGCGEVQNSVIMPNLKRVTIDFFVIRENELKLIKYLLKHAKGLQKMTIANASNDHIKEIKKYEKASGVELIFLIRD